MESEGMPTLARHPERALHAVILEVFDKHAQARSAPIAQLLVERAERYEHDNQGVLLRASVRICYRVIAGASDQVGRGGEFCGGYSRYGGSPPDWEIVSLSSPLPPSGSYVKLEVPGLENQGLGTFLFNQVVQWVRQWPTAQVNTVTLMPGQGTDDNKARRNRFYERFGIRFDFDDPECRTGRSQPMLAAELIPLDQWVRPGWEPNVVVRPAFEYLQSLHEARLHQDLTVVGLKQQCLALNEHLAKIDAHPLLWAVGTVCRRHAVPLSLLACLVIVVATSVGGGA